MRLKSSGFWTKKFSGKYIQISWLEETFTYRQLRLLALHVASNFLPMYEMNNFDQLKELIDDFYEFLEGNIEYNKTLRYTKENFILLGWNVEDMTSFKYRILHSIFFATIRKLDTNNVYYSLNYAALYKNNKPIQSCQKQNQLIGLFLPLENWNHNWHTENTTQLAQAIYLNKSWDLCPILADALMDAGCEDPYIIWMLKTQWHKFNRGVWIIDALTGRIAL